MEEQTTWWRVPDPGEPELLRATFRTQTFSRHAHERFAIGVIEAGGLTFRYRGQTVTAPAGWVNLAYPGEAHTGQGADGSGWTYRMFYLDPRQMAEIARDLDPGNSALPFIPAGAVWDPVLARRVAALHRLCEAPASEPLERQSGLVALVRTVIRRHSVAPGERPVRPARAEVRLAQRFIEEAFDRPIALEDLAALVNLHPCRLVRSFTQSLGMPPHAYLVQVRVRRAAALLRQGTLPGRAAAESGFSDQSHLNRHFVRYFGITPGRYRKAFRA